MRRPVGGPRKRGAITAESFRLELKFWGVRGSIPTPQCDNLRFGGNTTCLEIRLPTGEVLIIDGGTGLRNLGVALTREFSGAMPPLHFLMTHFHWDHIQGIPFFAPLYNPANTVTFHSSHDGDHLREILGGQMRQPYFPVAFDSLPAQLELVCVPPAGIRYGGLNIRPFPLNHPQGATGYRMESEGAVIVHASDFEHGNPRMDALLREYAQNADILIYDAQYTPEEYESKRGWGHSTWTEGVRLARACGVKKLILFHHDPMRDDIAMERIVEQARNGFESTDAAKEGWSIRI